MTDTYTPVLTRDQIAAQWHAPCMADDTESFARRIERAAIEAYQRQQWRPIDTAPRDGTEVLCWREDCGQFIASYTSHDAFPLTQAEIDQMDEETLLTRDWFTQWPQALRLDGSETPTHWMPLPPPPEQST